MVRRTVVGRKDPVTAKKPTLAKRFIYPKELMWWATKPVNIINIPYVVYVWNRKV